MAKQNQGGGERSKVRILFVEGDFAPGDLHELTHALTNAIRPPPPGTRGTLSSRPLETIVIGSGNDEKPREANESGGDNFVSEFGDDVGDEVVRAPKNPGKPRVHRKPLPVEMDMTAGGKAFADFAKEKGPTTHRDKYLVAATWLNDFAKLDTITADHVYTCYKSADWIFDVSDPTVTFRKLKGEGLGSIKRGSFKINHLGIAEVGKMKPST